MQLHFAEVGGVHLMKATNFCIISHRADCQQNESAVSPITQHTKKLKIKAKSKL